MIVVGLEKINTSGCRLFCRLHLLVLNDTVTSRIRSLYTLFLHLHL